MLAGPMPAHHAQSTDAVKGVRVEVVVGTCPRPWADRHGENTAEETMDDRWEKGDTSERELFDRDGVDEKRTCQAVSTRLGEEVPCPGETPIQAPGPAELSNNLLLKHTLGAKA